MRLDFAFLANAATLTSDGQFAVVGGGFDVLHARAFPVIKSAMALVGRIRFGPDEIGDRFYLVHAQIIGPDEEMLSPDLWLRIKPVPFPGNWARDNWMTVCFNYEGIAFAGPGTYRIRLSAGESTAPGEQQVLGDIFLEVMCAETQQ